MSTVKQYKCINCNAGLEFDPPSGMWQCHYCFSSFKKEDLDQVQPQANSEVTDELNQEIPELDSYHCSNCGAELITGENISATSCIYCKSPAIIKSRFSGRFKPKYLIPFKLTQEQADNLYKGWISKRIFAPKEFKNISETKELTGIYAPYWMFDCMCAGEIQGEGTKVHSWRSGNYRYTNTKYYHVLRAGTAAYQNIPIDASKRLNDELMELIEPYDYSGLTDFSMQYLSGFLSEKFDVDDKQASAVMEKRVDEYFGNRLRGTISGYNSYNTTSKQFNILDRISKYALLPVYLLIKKYNNKEYTFIINGQTGKVVGKAPVSAMRVISFSALVFFIALIIGAIGGALIG